MELLKNRVTEKINLALQKIEKIKKSPAIRIEYTRDEKFGDYACTIAMDKRFRELWSKNQPEYKNPKKLAEAIVKNLQDEIPDFFSSVEIAGPGFINLTLAPNVLVEYLQMALNNVNKYGHQKKEKPRKIIFEYVSANPTGPLNVVSARAGALGDSCCNLLEAIGETVHREFYVNDYGNQVTLLGFSSLIRYAEASGIQIKFAKKDKDGNAQHAKKSGLPFPEEGYHGDYLKLAVFQIFQKKSIPSITDEIIQSLGEYAKKNDCKPDFYLEEQFQKPAQDLGIAILSEFLESQKKDLKDFRVSFDEYFKESQLHEKNKVLSIREKLKKDIFKKEGKEFFNSTRFGDDKDRVIVRDDGRPTYLLADIAYHHSKIERGFDQILNIWGPDHHGYITRLAGALQSMGFAKDKFRVLIAQQVNLLENGQQIKMSKRAGKVITMRELINDIPVDVTRYFFAMRSFEAHLDFDLTEAKDTSEKNPYYYVAYAHARIQSIFRKLKEEKKLEARSQLNLSPSFVLTPERRKLLWLISKFPEEVNSAASLLEPHHLVNYLYSLASTLSSFYARKENRIISQDEALAQDLLTILAGVAICLKNGLQLLGMNAPDKM